MRAEREFLLHAYEMQALVTPIVIVWANEKIANKKLKRFEKKQAN